MANATTMSISLNPFPELSTIAAPGGAAATIPTVVSISLIFFWVLYKSRFGRDLRLAPGPFSWPIIGNLHLLGELPHRSLCDLAKQYGPVMFMRLGSIPTVVVSSSEMAKVFLKTQDLMFVNRPPMAAAKHVGYDGKNTGLVSYGSYSTQMKKISTMELMSAKRLESFRSVREEEVSLAVRSIWEKSQQGTVPVNVSRSLSNLISAIVWRILAGTKYSDDDVVGNDKGKELKEMAFKVTNMVGAFNIGDFIPSLGWLDDLRGMKRVMRKVHNFFDAVVERIVDEHVERRLHREKENGQAQEYTKDLVDVLLDMEIAETYIGDKKFTREHIKANIFDLFVGGIETTSTTLEWAMSELIRHPEAAKKLQDEIEFVVGKQRTVTESDLPKMEYLQCVVKETLRLYPAGPLMLPHEATQACTAAGYHIPHKTRIIVNVWAIGRDPAVWEDPLTFKPERFMGKNIDVKGGQFDMLPFGAGRRGCPGILMALGNIEISLAWLMHCFDWRIEGDPSKLDMGELFGASMPRKINLHAIPTLKLSNCSPFI